MAKKANPRKKTLPGQHQKRQPGRESEMTPKPKSEDQGERGSGKLQNKVALITGGDSGIGRAVAIAFAKEGADIAVAYLNEHPDAEETRALVEKEGKRCILFPGDGTGEKFCRDIEKISSEQLEKTFRTNIFSMFYTTKAALKHLL